MKVHVAKKTKQRPALGLHCLFHVRTSGDIKGLLRGLSLGISSAPTVCARDPGIRLLRHSITAMLKALVGAEAVLRHLPAVLCVCACVFVACSEISKPPSVVGRS